LGAVYAAGPGVAPGVPKTRAIKVVVIYFHRNEETFKRLKEEIENRSPHFTFEFRRVLGDFRSWIDETRGYFVIRIFICALGRF
jgi:hypothetical protein